MKQLKSTRRQCPSTSPLHHARRLRISILLLQLLCLPPCCVPVDAPRTAATEIEEAEMQHEHNAASSLEDRNHLRAQPSSMTGRLNSSFMDGLYALIGLAYDSDAAPLLRRDEYGASSESHAVIKTIGRDPDDLDQEGKFDESRESSQQGDDRRLQSRTSNSEWCK